MPSSSRDPVLTTRGVAEAGVSAAGAVALCLAAVHRLGGGRPSLVGCVVAAFLAEWPLSVLHEAAHALMVYLVGLPVAALAVAPGGSTRRRTWRGVEVRLGFSVGRSHVEMGECSGRRALPVRMVAVFLAGPVAYLLIAALAWAAARYTAAPVTVRAAIAGVAAMAAARGLLTILPVPTRYPFLDGWSAVSWLVWPERMTRVQRDTEVNRAAGRAWRAGAPVDRAALATVLDSPHPDAAGYAVQVLMATGDATQRGELVDRLGCARVLALADRLPPRSAVDMVVPVMDTLIGRFGRPDDGPARARAAADVVALAEACLRISPDRVEARTALALALLRQDQPDRARETLRRADTTAAPPTVRANLLAVWALVEADADPTRARYLLEQATSADPRAHWVGIVTRITRKREA